MSEIQDFRYTVKELGDLLEVPRTTINDWVSRYSRQVRFRQRGKRKLYHSDSVEILKSVKQWRDEGLSLIEIEDRLETQPAKLAGIECQEKDEEEQVAAKLATALQQQNETVTKLIGDQLREINQRLDKLDNANNLLLARNRRWAFFTLILIITLLCLAWACFLRDYSPGLKNPQNIAESSSDLKTNSKFFQTPSINLNSPESEVLREMQAYEVEFQKTLEELKSKPDGAKPAEILELRDRFAGKRLELLKSLEK